MTPCDKFLKAALEAAIHDGGGTVVDGRVKPGHEEGREEAR